MALRTAALLIAPLALFTVAWGQANQGVRLADSPLGNHAGRVEVMYNGQWGTICNIGWSPYDARVVCNMLNYTDYVCAIGSTGIGVFGEGTGPVWLSGLRCGYLDKHLDECRGNQPQNNPCLHYRDASVICQDPSVMPVPFNITQVETRTRSIKIQWMLSSIPPYIQVIQFRLYVRQPGYYRSYIYRTFVGGTTTVFNYTLSGLSINQTYEFQIRADGEYRFCSTDIIGVVSAPVNITTTDKVPPSTLPIRLVSYPTTNQPHIGRLEVYHNNQWGTVCDDLFGQEEADLACRELNYTAGAVCYATRPFPISAGPTWLDNVDCSLADRFEDCSHSGWGVHNCAPSESVGLICNPGPAGIPSVTDLEVTQLSHNSVTFQWKSKLTVGRYRIRYTRETGFSYNAYVTHPTTQYSLWRLYLGYNYTINVSAAVTFRNYYGGNCYYSYLYGEESDTLIVEPKETAPTVSVSGFHITILNGTSVEATWTTPRSTIGVNGIIRGFKIFIEKVNGSERVINISDTLVRSYIITDLEGLATYVFSMLLYNTVADGPKGIHLTQEMPNASYVPLIAQFGVYGNGLETVTYYTYRSGFDVLCGSYVKNAALFWQFANGSRIGISNPGFRAGHFENGTAVLQIGTALTYIRRLSVCDGGLYTCIATAPGGRMENRNFTLFIGSSIPAVNQPRLISKGSTWVQIGWESLDCDGGYQIDGYDVEYRLNRGFFFRYTYTTVARVSSLNYTIRELSPNTLYYFRVSTVSSVSSRTAPSSNLPVTTQVSGPSPPRSVTVRVTSNSEVCATWRPPATYTGVVTLYRLYAEIIDSSADITEAVDLPTDTAVKTFAGSVLSGCMELSHTGVIYHFQMSAVSTIQGELVEGTLSPMDARTTIYVPRPGIPQPIDLQGNATNTSVNLQWRLPGNVQQDDLYFNVSYSGVVDWKSNKDVYISFKEQGQTTADNTSLVIYPLTPSTEYVFKVVAVTSEGQGEEAVVVVTTNKEVGDKLAYFQIRILDINDCEEWHSEGTKQKLDDIRKSLVSILNAQCTCDITTSHISQGEFSCRSDPNDSIVYRARISGTPTVSASDLATQIRNWVQGESASIMVGSLRLHLDPNCDATLDNIHALDCNQNVVVVTDEEPTDEEPTDEEPTDDKTDETDSSKDGDETDSSKDEEDENSKSDLRADENNDSSTSSGEVVGIMVGGIIAGLLLALLIALIIIIIVWLKKLNSQSFKAQSVFTELVNDPSGHGSAMTTEDDKTEKL